MTDLTDRCDYCGIEISGPDVGLSRDYFGRLICIPCIDRAERFAPESNIDIEEKEKTNE